MMLKALCGINTGATGSCGTGGWCFENEIENRGRDAAEASREFPTIAHHLLGYFNEDIVLVVAPRAQTICESKQ